MSPLRGRLLALAACAAGTLLFGCSSQNPDSFIDPNTGRHAASWLPAGHAAAASSGTTSAGNAIPSVTVCAQCHGADLSGGISGVSCTLCHLGGPTSLHPENWIPIVLTHGPSVSAGTTAVAKCANQYCHGPSLAGVPGSGPACTECHSWPFDPASIHCGSCHGIPPSGTRYPDMAGRHTLHMAMTGTTLAPAACTVCHSGTDGVSGSTIHFNNAVEIVFSSVYNAKTGAASYNAAALTCSQVSCHGGQTTPNWFSGTIDVNAQCSSCHSSGTTQYNSYNSGEHSLHLGGVGAVCTDCHDTAKLAAVHFSDLSSPTPTTAYLTMQNFLNYTGTGGGTFGTCTMTCHGEQHSSRQW